MDLMTSSTPSIRVRADSVLRGEIEQMEKRQWWFWASAIMATFLLAAGFVSFTFPFLIASESPSYFADLKFAVQGLIALVFLFDLYLFYQHLLLYRIRRALVQQERIFHLIAEHAADLIAVVDAHGNRLYNSPSYQKILG